MLLFKNIGIPHSVLRFLERGRFLGGGGGEERKKIYFKTAPLKLTSGMSLGCIDNSGHFEPALYPAVFPNLQQTCD